MHFEVQEDVFDSHPDARDDKQPWVLPSFDYSYTPDEAGVRRRAQSSTSTRASLTRSELDETASYALPAFEERIRGIDGTSQPPDRRGGMEAVLHHRRRPCADAAAGIPGRHDPCRPVRRLGRGDQLHGRQSVDRRRLRHPFGLPPLHGDRRPGTALSGAVLVDRAPAMCWSRWRRFSRVRTRAMVRHARHSQRGRAELRLRRVDAVRARQVLRLRPRRGRHARQSRPALLRHITTMAGRPTACSASPIIWPATIPSRRPTWSMSAPFRDWRPRRRILSACSASRRPAGCRLPSARASTSRRSKCGAPSSRPATHRGRSRLSAKYAYIQAQPLYGFPTDRRELTLGASARVHEYWRVFGSGTYDFEKDVLVQDSFGFAYDDECFSYLMTFSETPRPRHARKSRTASASTCRSARSAISAPRRTASALGGRRGAA